MKLTLHFALPNPADTALPWEWAMTQGVAQYPVEPLHSTITANLPAYEMPPADPVDPWADITGVPCPVPGCTGTLVWYENGYVPGHRVCMEPSDMEPSDSVPDVFNPLTIKHWFQLREPSTLVHYRTT